MKYTYQSDSKENKIKTTINYRAGDESKEIYFYGDSFKIDSIQRLTNNKWYETAQFEYDTLTDTKFIYLKYSTYRALRTKVIYNKDGYPKYSLTNELPNWNQTKIYNLEIIESYNNDGTTKECEIIVDGKKRFSKVHTYLTF